MAFKLIALKNTWGLPLLTKELLEQSARRRTYVMRTVYAIVLYIIAITMFWETISISSTSVSQMLGQGRKIFTSLVWLQFLGVYLFMPALTCGVLTYEKERDSFALLILTRLAPRTILLEKLLSRVLLMFSFELMLLPLLGLAYSLAGVPGSDFVWASWYLAVTTIQVGCFALCCSAFFRTTVEAFIASYVLGVPLLFCCTAPCSGSPLVYASGRGYDNLTDMALSTGLGLPILASAGFFFLMARVFVLDRAFVQPANLALRVFRFFDAFFMRMNDNSFTRGVVLIDPRQSTPGDQPVRWRETSKSVMGTASHLMRAVVLLESPIVVLFFAGSGRESGPALSAILLAIWCIVALVIAVRAAGLISGERSHQTLDVLLTTPLTTREIITQKFSGLTLAMFALSVPMLSVVAFEASFRGLAWPQRGSLSLAFTGPIYVVSSLLSILIYPRLIAWIAFYIGLRSRTRGRGILITMGVLVAWCLLPAIFPDVFFQSIGITDHPLEMCVPLLSPTTMILFTEYRSPYLSLLEASIAVGVNFAFYEALCQLIRWHCLKNADEFLRGEGSRGSAG